MKRQIIKIDEEKCTGCGDCIPGCKEGALQVIDGKCRLVSELFCDGLGACIGHCPEGAIIIEEREAKLYSEELVIESLLKKPESVMIAHLKHLKEHGAMDYYNQAVDYLNKKGIENPLKENSPAIPEVLMHKHHNGSACPGSQIKVLNVLKPEKKKPETPEGKNESLLEQWPVQLHLVNPAAPYFNGKELVIMSTCGPIASANVHTDYLAGRSVVVACPKLDYTEPYAEKLSQIFSNNDIPKAIVVRMEVPCCSGLSKIAKTAVLLSRNNIEIEEHVMDLHGNIVQKIQLSDKTIEINR